MIKMYNSRIHTNDTIIEALQYTFFHSDELNELVGSTGDIYYINRIDNIDIIDNAEVFIPGIGFATVKIIRQHGQPHYALFLDHLDSKLTMLYRDRLVITHTPRELPVFKFGMVFCTDSARWAASYIEKDQCHETGSYNSKTEAKRIAEILVAIGNMKYIPPISQSKLHEVYSETTAFHISR